MLQVVNLIAIQDNCVLLARDREGNWNLPGGKIDDGETPEWALRRELREELPHLKVVGELRRWETFQGVTPNSRQDVEVQTFFADVTGSIQPGAEVTDAKWTSRPSEFNVTKTSWRILAALNAIGYLDDRGSRPASEFFYPFGLGLVFGAALASIPWLVQLP